MYYIFYRIKEKAKGLYLQNNGKDYVKFIIKNNGKSNMKINYLQNKCIMGKTVCKIVSAQ